MHRLSYFILRFVRVGDPKARLTNMYDTSAKSWASGAVDGLLFSSLPFV